MNKPPIPAGALAVLQGLEQAGYEAWLVGGCVRDSLLGREAQDWDIATGARPEQVMECLSCYKLLPTGLDHGTITVVVWGRPFEVTTFRKEGSYRDHRHPDRVVFGVSLAEDLARRDFTVNGLAYHPERGLADYFGGAEDLGKGLIRAIGEPGRRFEEDGLRIMRALRFAATLDFTIEAATGLSIRSKRDLLQCLAAERLQSELLKLLTGKGAPGILRDYSEVIGVFIPEILPLVGFDQHNPYHHLDAWEHTLLALDLVFSGDALLSLAALLHDIGKPDSFKRGDDGVAHFYGHPQLGAELARGILERLRFPKEAIHDVCELVLYHDAEIPAQAVSVRRWLNRLGERQLRRLLALRRADALAHHPERLHKRLREWEELTAVVEQVLAEGQCYSLAMLAVNGHDLQQLGLKPGPALGQALDELLKLVIGGVLPNERETLLNEAKTFLQD